MKKVILAFVFGSLALVLLSWITATIGAYLPKQHTVTVSQRFVQPPDSIWNALTDFSSYPVWRKNIEKVEVISQSKGHTVWREFAGRGKTTTFTTVNVEPPHIFIIETADRDRAFSGRWTMEIKTDKDGSILIITERATIENSILRVIARYIIGLDTTVESYLHSLKVRFGQEPE